MNFQQLKIIRETVRQNYNLTGVAAALYTSQSGVSKHIKDLEDELGVELFIRRGKRLLGLTEAGQNLVGIVERILVDTANIKKMGQHFAQRDQGHLTIATTHTQARYALTSIVATFMKRFPKVRLALRQESPQQIAALLVRGEADIGIATDALADIPQLRTFPFYTWSHAVVVPSGHPLETAEALTLNAIASYPLITYHEGFTGRDNIDRSFTNVGEEPEIVMSAMDTDVIKTYVKLGLGVGIIASMGFDASADEGLTMLPSQGLFPENTTWLAVHKDTYLPAYAQGFLDLCSPALRESRLSPARRQRRPHVETEAAIPVLAALPARVPPNARLAAR